MRVSSKRMHRMHLVVETKTQHGGCLKHVCEDCRADVHALASIAERLAIMRTERDGVPSPLLEETYGLIVRLGLVRERINPGWGPPASLTLGRAGGSAGPPASRRGEPEAEGEEDQLPEDPRSGQAGQRRHEDLACE